MRYKLILESHAEKTKAIVTRNFQIRQSAAKDNPAILSLYPRAFPEEELRPLVTALLEPGEPVLSLIAEDEGEIVGHVCFTRCGIVGGNDPLALLGPLAVSPPRQKQGIGSALIGEGNTRMAEDGVCRVLVLGDPAYYGRFGFAEESGIETPIPIPPEWHSAWQSLALGGEKSAIEGLLDVPSPWGEPDLWAS